MLGEFVQLTASTINCIHNKLYPIEDFNPVVLILTGERDYDQMQSTCFAIYRLRELMDLHGNSQQL